MHLFRFITKKSSDIFTTFIYVPLRAPKFLIEREDFEFFKLLNVTYNRRHLVGCEQHTNYKIAQNIKKYNTRIEIKLLLSKQVTLHTGWPTGT